MPPTFRCQYCARPVPTRAGIKRHISNTKGCRDKWAQDLGAISVTSDEGDRTPTIPEPVVDSSAHSPAPSEDDDPMGLADGFVAPAPPESPPPPEPIQRSRRATVEEVLDEDDPQNFQRFVDIFPGSDAEAGESEAGKPLRPGETLFERMQKEQEMAGDSKFAPFMSRDEWDLAKWLSKNVSQTATEEYLKLPIVSESCSAIELF